jgi:hypothetical protein
MFILFPLAEAVGKQVAINPQQVTHCMPGEALSGGSVGQTVIYLSNGKAIAVGKSLKEVQGELSGALLALAHATGKFGPG